MSKSSFRGIKKPVVQPAGGKAFSKLRTGLGTVIAAFAFILYAQSISFNYTLDDSASIKDNTITTQGLHGIPTLLSTDYWYGSIESLRVPQYRPGPLVLFAIEWQFFPNNPHAGHLVNVLLYSLTCFLLFILLCELFAGHTVGAKANVQSLIVPFVCSLLYVAHPIHTEVVDSIKSSDEILCFLFSIISTMLIIQYLKRPSSLKLVLASVVYFAALLSKETSLTFLIVIPLTAFVFTNSKAKQIATATLPLAIMAIVYLIIRAQVVKSVPSAMTESTLNNTLFSAPDAISRQATAFYILLRYIVLLIFPHPLSYDYSFAQIKIHSISDGGSILGIVIYSALGIYALMKIWKRSLVAFAILFFLVTLSVTSNVLILIGAIMAERFMYIPSLGYCIVLAWLLTKLTKMEIVLNKSNAPQKTKPAQVGFKQFFESNSFLFGVAMVITFAFSLKTFARSKDWKDNMTLDSHDVNVSPNSARAHHNLAEAILKEAYPIEKNETIKNNLLEQSISEYKKAIDIYGSAPSYFTDLALAYSLKNDHENAIINYETGIKRSIAPDGVAYANLGVEYFQTQQYDKAMSMLDSAIKYKPDLPNSYKNKGVLLKRQGRYEESIPLFMKTISLDSSNAHAYKYLAGSYFNTKHYPQAIESYNKSLVTDPDDLDAIYYLGLSYQMMGDSVKAKPYIEEYNRAKSKGN